MTSTIFCPIHGPGSLARARRNGRDARGRQRHVLVCAECHPHRRLPSVRGRDDCPRCGGKDIVLVRSGRPDQAPYRGCVDCRRAWERAYKVRAGVAETPDWSLGADPYVLVDEAIQSALAGSASARKGGA